MADSVTLARLAEAKALPVVFLRSLGWRETYEGVEIPYRNTDGSQHPRMRFRFALRAKDGSAWRGPTDVSPIPYGLDRLEAARRGGKLALCEGETDTASCWLAGLPALGLPGATTVKKLLQPGLLQGFSHVIVFQDDDHGGSTFVSAATSVALTSGVKRVQVIKMPAGCKDPNDWFRRAGDPKAFKAAIVAAVAATSDQLPSPTSETPPTGNASTRAADGPCVVTVSDLLRLEATLVGRNGTARVQAVSGDTVVHLEEMNLAKSGARRQFAEYLKEKGFVLDEAALLALATEFQAKQTPPPRPFEHSKGSAEVTLTPDVSEILSDSNPIRRVIDAIRAGGYVGDHRPPLLAYLALTSRLLQRPINLAFVAPSATGKNRTVDAALALVPSTAYYLERAGSERALIYVEEEFQHRVVVFAEADSIPDEGPAASAIRSLASDNVLAYDVPEQDPKTKRFVTRRIEKPGPTGLITTSTRSLQHQLGTRVLEVHLKDDPEQTRAVMGIQASLATGELSPAPTAEDLIQLQRWLETAGDKRVIVPFAPPLGELVPARQVRMRRDFPQLLSCIQAAALICQRHRERTVEGAIVAKLDDYGIARDVLAPIFDHIGSDGVTPAVRATVESVRHGEEISNASLAKRLGLEPSTVSWRVSKAVKGGWLKNAETRPGYPARLSLGDPLPSDVTMLPTVEAVQEAIDRSRRVRQVFESAEADGTVSADRSSVEAFECLNEFREGAVHDLAAVEQQPTSSNELDSGGDCFEV